MTPDMFKKPPRVICIIKNADEFNLQRREESSR